MQKLGDIREVIQRYASGFDASALTGIEALLGVREAARIKNIAAALEAACAARVSETETHRGSGDRSPAHVLARETGVTVGQARETIETAKRLADQPQLGAAALAGEVSPQEASAISAAGAVDPTAAKRLLAAARAGASLAETREEAARIRAAACPDPEARRRTIRAERYLRSWTDEEGAGNLRMRDNPEIIARIMARVDEETEVVFAKAYRSGRREPREAYAADALVALVAGAAAPTKGAGRPKIIFRVDWAAWLRGYPVGGEIMELVGYGPVAASAVDEAIAAGGFIAAVITKGQRLTGIAHLGRAPTAGQQSALEWLYPTCAALGCAAVARLQRDHRIDWADTHITMLEWLDLLCSHHHGLKTRANWQLVAGRGKRAFVPPEDPRHPGDVRANAPPKAAV